VVHENYNTDSDLINESRFFERKFMFSSDQLAEKVNSLTQSSASNILEIGLAFHEAKQHLKESDFQDFLNRTKYAEKSPMIRKWIGIGKSYQKLKSVSKQLPPVFTTIYKLSTITPDELNSLIKTGVLTPSVSTKEINDELHPKSKKQRNARLIIEFATPNCEFELKELCDLIESTYSPFVKLEMNDEAKDLLDAANSKSYPSLKAA
jgi:hypothetical protein